MNNLTKFYCWLLKKEFHNYSEHVKRLFKSEKFLAFFGISIGVSRRTFVDSTDAVDEDEDDDDEIDEDKLIGWEKL